MIKGKTNQNGMPIFSAPTSSSAPIDPVRFQSFIPRLTNTQMNWLIAQARQQGISEADINAGLAQIKKVR